MVLEFEKSLCPCLRKVIHQVQNQELTQEFRLPDGLPDIGKVLGCWGQVLIRGKEWRSDAMSVSGGVMIWVMYAPEDGTESKCLESWIPFQMKWSLPETQRDGTICVLPLLKSADARSISARKLMLRCVVSILGEAMEPMEEDVYTPVSVPEHVQLLRENYPAELPIEAGEKSFQVEETLSPTDMGQIVYYEIQPQITEQKIMASRLVFRGAAKLHMLYQDTQGRLQSFDADLPFAQYADLDQEYGSAATAWIIPILNGAETEITEEGKLLVKCAVTAQYVIYDRKMIETVTDAYSTKHRLQPQSLTLNLPMRLDVQQWQTDRQCPVQAENLEVLDAAVFYDHPVCRQDGDRAHMEMNIHCQLLFRDEQGNLQTRSGKEVQMWETVSDAANEMCCYPQYKGQTGINHSADGILLQPDIAVHTSAFSRTGIPAIQALDISDEIPMDKGRPSLILRRVGEQNLWQLAKACGSTVELIRSANQLQSEPQDGQMLLIPVL